MKKILLVLLLIPSFLGVKAQQDSAIMLVEGFLKFANYDSYVKDSVLYIESEIVKRYGEGDTVRMKRWYCPPNNYRIEVWSGRRPEVAMIGYKDSSFMYYFSSDRSWRHVHVDNFYQREWEYDFRSPLYFWKNNGMELTYEGTLDFEGSEVQPVSGLSFWTATTRSFPWSLRKRMKSCSSLPRRVTASVRRLRITRYRPEAARVF